MSFTNKTMPSFTPDIGGFPLEGLYVPTVDQRHRLGSRIRDGHGRSWRYIKNGATQLAAGLMQTSEATNGDVKDITQTGYTTAIGDTEITALFTTTNGIADGELLDGTLTVNSSTGLGYAYNIADNEYVTGDTVVSIKLYEPIRVATSATSVFTFTKNKHRDVIVAPATAITAPVVGATNVVIPASYFGWVQTEGYCPLLVDTAETVIIGALVGYPAAAAVAGACGVAAITEDIWGVCVEVAAATAYALIDLKLE
jgi:hypothetical protein